MRVEDSTGRRGSSLRQHPPLQEAAPHESLSDYVVSGFVRVVALGSSAAFQSLTFCDQGSGICPSALPYGEGCDANLNPLSLEPVLRGHARFKPVRRCRGRHADRKCQPLFFFNFRVLISFFSSRGRVAGKVSTSGRGPHGRGVTHAHGLELRREGCAGHGEKE